MKKPVTCPAAHSSAKPQAQLVGYKRLWGQLWINALLNVQQRVSSLPI